MATVPKTPDSMKKKPDPADKAEADMKKELDERLDRMPPGVADQQPQPHIDRNTPRE